MQVRNVRRPLRGPFLLDIALTAVALASRITASCGRRLQSRGTTSTRVCAVEAALRLIEACVTFGANNGSEGAQ